MLICRVVLGDAYHCKEYNEEEFRGTLEAPVKSAPLKPGSNERYDSIFVAGKVNGGDLVVYNEFVVYDADQVYPEYVIEYKRKLASSSMDNILVRKSIYHALLEIGGKG